MSANNVDPDKQTGVIKRCVQQHYFVLQPHGFSRECKQDKIQVVAQ